MRRERLLLAMASCLSARSVALAFAPLGRVAPPLAAPTRRLLQFASTAGPTAEPTADEAAAAAMDVLAFPAKSSFVKTLQDRGFLHQCTDLAALDEQLAGGSVVAYLGFDATASSLHVGSLLQIMLLRHFQKCGHKPIVLVGGGTTKIGDPSGKDESRKILDGAAIEANIDGISSVFKKFLKFGDGPTDAVLVDNDEWLSQLNYMAFLREFGPHFTINRMMSFDSVRLRLEREQPLSFLEFNYMIFQAYDFLELSRRHKCTLQFGGSDQWGNIVNGVELNRRVDQTQVYGLTAPLITTSDGKKMGKTADGAVWLNADLLTPYDYWQFWRNTNDADVAKFMRIFTELEMDEIEALTNVKGSEFNAAKVVLADACTTLLHGSECLASIKATAESMFSAGGGSTTADLPRVQRPAADLEAGVRVVDLLVELGMAGSKGEARRLIKQGGAKVDNVKVADEHMELTPAALNAGAEVKISAGKKKHGIVEFS